MTNYSVSTAAFHISYVCTHRCPMCYTASQKANNNAKHPPLSQAKRVVSALVENGITNISFVGGDPAMYPQILELSSYANLLGCSLSILSNTLEFGERAIDIANYIECFEGTIHDSTAEAHDAFCKKDGAYELLCHNLKYFSDIGKKIGLTLNLTPFTYNKILDIVSAIINRGICVDYLVFQRIIPFGRAENTHSYELTLQQLSIALGLVERVEKDFDLSITFEDPFPLCAIESKYHRYMHPCEWGLSKVSIDYNGNLSRCGADPRCTLGNIFDITSLSDLWLNAKELLEFRKKNYLDAKCHNCGLLNKCGGACPISRNPEIGYTQDYISRLEGVSKC